MPKDTIQLDPGFWTKTSWIQLLYGIWVNAAQLGIGLAFGLPAVQVPQLSAPGSNVPITRYEASWIASILTLFSPIGCLISGYIMDKYGRRIMIIVCHGPLSIGWLCTGLAKSPKQIILGRAITGIGCGMAMGPPRIYTTEISLPNMRGVIGAFPAMAISLGISIQAGLGSIFSWETLCYLCSVYSLVNLCVFMLLPETPYYILKTGTIEQARLALTKFRGSQYDINSEMNQLREFKMDNDIRKLTLKESIKALFTRSSCLPFGLISTYIIITQTSGVSCILMWAVEILTQAKSSFNLHTGNFLLALTRLLVGTLTSILLFKIGRKPMALTSAIGVSFISFSLGFYIYYNDEPSLVPQCCFMLYMAFASLGYYTLPFLIAAELYPLQVRGLLGGITVSLTSFLIFGSAKVFPLLMDSIGLAYTMLIFGACSLMGAIFLYFYLPETKELTLQEIEEYYNARRPTLVSQRRLVTLQSQKLLSDTTKFKTKSATLQKSTEHTHKNLQISSRISSNILAKLESKKKLSSLLRRKYFTKEGDATSSTSISSAESLKKEFSLANKESLSIKGVIKSKESVRIIEPVTSEESAQESKKSGNNLLTDNQAKKSSKQVTIGNETKRSSAEHSADNVAKNVSTEHVDATDNEPNKSSKDNVTKNESKKSSKEHVTDNVSEINSKEHSIGHASEKSSKEHFTGNESAKSSKEHSTGHVSAKSSKEHILGHVSPKSSKEHSIGHASVINSEKSSTEHANTADNESKKITNEGVTDEGSKNIGTEQNIGTQAKRLRQIIEKKSKEGVGTLREFVEKLIKKRNEESMIVTKESDTKKSETSGGTNDDNTDSENQPSTSKKR